jgi:hypothetical protein
METIFQYADGSANRYIISKEMIEYVPVKKENSSTGFYSGGEPAKKEITPLVFSELQKKLMALIDQRDLHIEDRIKMSGVITHNSECHKEKYIIKPCDQIRQLEGFLKELILK